MVDTSIASASSLSQRPRCWATPRRIRARCLAKLRRGFSICWRPGARPRWRAAVRADLRGRGWQSRRATAFLAPLGSASPLPVLVFLEDISQIEEKAQQAKLAALGRLSASIAHEIRNPIGAMSHAGQLLAESGEPREGRPATHGDHPLERGLREHHHQQRPAARAERQPGRNGSPCRTGWKNSAASSARPCSCPTPVSWSRHPRSRWKSARTRPQLLARSSGTCATTRSATAAPATTRPAKNRTSWKSAPDAWPAGARPFLEIADRGPGVGENQIDRIFEPFFTTGRGGTGLGLFLARELAQTNGASYIASPARGRQRVPPWCSPTRRDGSYDNGRLEFDRPRMTKPHVLIVDDEPDLLELVSLTLSRMNLDTRTAADVGVRAETAERRSFRPVPLRTCACPMRSGLDLVAWIQKECRQVPVAVITAHGNVRVRGPCAQARRIRFRLQTA